MVFNHQQIASGRQQSSTWSTFLRGRRQSSTVIFTVFSLLPALLVYLLGYIYTVIYSLLHHLPATLHLHPPRLLHHWLLLKN